MLVERRNCRKNSCFWKLWWLISCKMSTTYSCVIYFLSQLFSLLIADDLFRSGYRFANDLWQNCKEVVDLRFIHRNAPQLSGIFFVKFTDTKLVYKLVVTQLNLFITFNVLFFQFSFVLPAIYVRMRNFTGKPKETQVVYMQRFIVHVHQISQDFIFYNLGISSLILTKMESILKPRFQYLYSWYSLG